jgi:hypothetical protein
MRHRERERIDRLERNGTMDRRRGELHAWFTSHPRRNPLQAVQDLQYTHQDYMYVVADSVRIDLMREENVSP